MYTVFNRIYGEKIESNNFHELMKYARQLRREIPFSEFRYNNGEWELIEGKPSEEEEQLIKQFEWCGRDWVKQQIWNGNDTKDKIWKVIRSLPEYYFG